MAWKSIYCILLVTFCCYAAQAQPATPVAKWKPLPYFVGFHFQEGQYEVYFPSTYNDAIPGSWEFTAGLAVSSRFVVQTGFSHVHDLFVFDPSYTGTTLSGDYVSGKDRDENSVYCAPVLVRYSLFSKARARLQIDAILGLTFLKNDVYNDREGSTNNVITFSRHQEYHSGLQSYLTAGVGFRYPFGHHVEAVVDWIYNRNFHETSERVHLDLSDNKWGFTDTRSLGIRYRFNLKKPAAAP